MEEQPVTVTIERRVVFICFVRPISSPALIISCLNNNLDANLTLVCDRYHMTIVDRVVFNQCWFGK